MHHVLQLAHVAWPGSLDHHFNGSWREAGDLARLVGAGAAQEVVYQQRDILPPVGEGRQMEVDHVQAVEQVLAKQARSHLAFEVPVGGRYDAHVHRFTDCAADGAHSAFLQGAQQLHLHRQRHVADFIQKEGATLGGPEQPRVFTDCPGESTLDVAEQFRFQQLFGQGAAVNGNKGATPLRVCLMYSPGQQFLAAATGAGNQDAHVGPGNLAYLVEDTLHHRASGHHVLAPRLDNFGLGSA